MRKEFTITISVYGEDDERGPLFLWAVGEIKKGRINGHKHVLHPAPEIDSLVTFSVDSRVSIRQKIEA